MLYKISGFLFFKILSDSVANLKNFWKFWIFLDAQPTKSAKNWENVKIQRGSPNFNKIVKNRDFLFGF